MGERPDSVLYGWWVTSLSQHCWKGSLIIPILHVRILRLVRSKSWNWWLTPVISGDKDQEDHGLRPVRLKARIIPSQQITQAWWCLPVVHQHGGKICPGQNSDTLYKKTTLKKWI
jgi:hypothetical protein